MSDYDTVVIRKRIRVYGSVQAVGFRYRAEHAANHVGVTGWVCNEADGSVLLEVQGTEAQIVKLFALISEGRYVDIQRMEAKTIPLEEESYFRIRG